MKKAILKMMVGLLIIGLVGCGSTEIGKPKNVSKEVYEHGIAIVEVMDKYLDDTVPAEDVAMVMFSTEIEFDTDEEKVIENYINVLWEFMLKYSKNKEKCIEFRNDLAKSLNLDEIGLEDIGE